MGRKHVGSADLEEWVRKQKEAPRDEKRIFVEEEHKKREEKEEEKKLSPLGPFLPEGIYAHFLLIDIAPPIKYVREIPLYFPIKQTRTLVGSHINAHVRLDDQHTVQNKHAKVIYEEMEGKREFVIYPIERAQVFVNAKTVSSDGVALKSGDRVKIGSADLIIFHVDVKKHG
jgi:hypothetical protein